MTSCRVSVSISWPLANGKTHTHTHTCTGRRKDARKKNQSIRCGSKLAQKHQETLQLRLSLFFNPPTRIVDNIDVAQTVINLSNVETQKKNVKQQN